MLSIIIFTLIIVGLIIHRYLTNFWEQGMLPYAMGFLMFANILSIIYLVNFIWMFGFVLGIIITALTFFQIVFASFLWPFLLPQLISIHKDQPSSKLFSKLTNVNPFIYGSFSFLVIGLGLLTIINFFVSDYASLTKTIVDFFDGNYIAPIFWIVSIAIISNIIRIYILRCLQMSTSKDKPIKESEIKEVDAILDEAGNQFDIEGASWDLVRGQIEKSIHSNPSEFIRVIRKGRDIRKYIYSAIANISGDMVESGQYHIWRGGAEPDYWTGYAKNF